MSIAMAEEVVSEVTGQVAEVAEKEGYISDKEKEELIQFRNNL